jgi:hypothetical protein
MTNGTQGPVITGLPGIAANITYMSQCTPALCSMKYATIEYVPNLHWNEGYLGCFAILLLVQIILVAFYRTWSYTAAMFCGLILECVGYYGRLQMHFHVFDSGPFLM